VSCRTWRPPPRVRPLGRSRPIATTDWSWSRPVTPAQNTRFGHDDHGNADDEAGLLGHHHPRGPLPLSSGLCGLSESRELRMHSPYGAPSQFSLSGVPRPRSPVHQDPSKRTAHSISSASGQQSSRKPGEAPYGSKALVRKLRSLPLTSVLTSSRAASFFPGPPPVVGVPARGITSGGERGSESTPSPRLRERSGQHGVSSLQAPPLFARVPSRELDRPSLKRNWLLLSLSWEEVLSRSAGAASRSGFTGIKAGPRRGLA
jgi:hypothetical protein